MAAGSLSPQLTLQAVDQTGLLLKLLGESEGREGGINGGREEQRRDERRKASPR